jgi:hypothetical protein
MNLVKGKQMKDCSVFGQWDGTCGSTALDLAIEVKRVQAEKRHAIANTPLASVPLAQGGKKARRPGVIRPKPQVMRHARSKGQGIYGGVR